MPTLRRSPGFNYTYDNEGNKQDEQKTQDTTHSEAYKYDNTYRLITLSVGTLVGTTVPVPSTQTSYSLDPVGNWNSKTTNSVIQSRTHNVTNELVEINSTTLTYDANGNPINDGTFTYSYDEENRLTQVTPVSSSTAAGQYEYDAMNRRVQKIADPAGSPATTLYFYDDIRVIEEQNGSNATQATYVYGNLYDEILTMNRGGQAYYYHPNALWSVAAVTNSAGTPVERYSYEAYGFVTITDGSFNPVAPNSWGTPHSAIGNPWTFTARQLDEETVLTTNGRGGEDSGKGRFLQRDALEYLVGRNWYEYVHSNPTDNVDPFGLDDRKDMPRPDFEKWLKDKKITLEDWQKAILNYGCIGIACLHQGQKRLLPNDYRTWPEKIKGTKCYLDEDDADKRKCPDDAPVNIVFAKQGKWRKGKPTPNKDGEVDNTAITGVKNVYDFNYVTKLGKEWYVWANVGGDGVGNNENLQRITVSKVPEIARMTTIRTKYGVQRVSPIRLRPI